ncbi:MAG: signal recognition particle-docking protein FtsY [Campylobacterota bacterium]
MFSFFKKGLAKTSEAIKEVVPKKQTKLDIDTVEDLLLEADMSYELVETVINGLPQTVNRIQLYNSLISLFIYDPKEYVTHAQSPYVEMIIGVNGAGKTTTIAKLAQKYKNEGKQVMLGAGDTFRAAAIEQLTKWAQKIEVPIVSTKHGHDPSAVVYDTILSAKSKGCDNVIIDTAGRLHNHANLSNELQKMARVADKAHEGAPHRKILILDGTQGSSSINQAKQFDQIIGIDGIIITKLDGTAKGGSLFTIASELKLPIFYIGVGETSEDLVAFNPKDYINTILDEVFVG